ncbi:serine/threonine-protein kinase [Pseudoduganella lurida]|uniref:Serine/threonine-protein kinase n=1 Tax=Pseudoduganella lurida TaxID=1036180 RepID=A0A562RK38_9BURK|nr:serine/threonine-protein kinase [Pseudoduganella lurida]TWI69408.1 serine/threonine-protein kinase [Pseudoduganella lurida]
MTEPEQLGRYRLLRVLGRGAMGLVYEGIDPRLERRVAIKVILTQQLDAAQRADYSARFVREAQAVARLNHPNIVTVYDFGEEGDVAYLVMEVIEGEELSGYFDADQAFQLEFTLEDAVRMTGELLDAIGYAHQNGVVHRDIKPANIMLSAQLRVKLTDFGVARLHDRHAPAAADSEVVGTPSYMAPEQIAGQVAGPRADIFAAGIILYQFLTGEKPFRAPTLGALQHQILYDRPALPSVANPSVGPQFDRVVLRALAKRPEDRYPTAAAFRQDLMLALRGGAAGDHTVAITRPPDIAMSEADNADVANDRASDADGSDVDASDMDVGGAGVSAADACDADATVVASAPWHRGGTVR